MRTTLDSYRGEQFTMIGSVVRGEAVATADVLAGATTIPLDSTAGYPGSGTVVVGGALVTYAALTATSLTGCAGTPAIKAGTVVPYAIDLRLANTVLDFQARRSRGETGTPIIEKQTGGNGVVIPGAAPGHLYNIAILSADTDGFTKTEELVWELRLTEPNSDETVIATGDWRVAEGAS